MPRSPGSLRSIGRLGRGIQAAVTPPAGDWTGRRHDLVQLLADEGIAFLGDQPLEEVRLAFRFQRTKGNLLHLEVAQAELEDQHSHVRRRIGINPRLERLEDLPGTIDYLEIVALPSGVFQGRLRRGTGLPEPSRGPFPHDKICAAQFGDGLLDFRMRGFGSSGRNRGRRICGLRLCRFFCGRLGLLAARDIGRQREAQDRRCDARGQRFRDGLRGRVVEDSHPFVSAVRQGGGGKAAPRRKGQFPLYPSVHQPCEWKSGPPVTARTYPARTTKSPKASPACR